MFRIRLMVPVCVVGSALSMLCSAGASAATAGWMINKTNLTTTAALATTSKVDQKSKLAAAGITIECKGEVLRDIGAKLNQATLMADAESIEFTECESISAGCNLGQSTVKTLPLLVDVTLDGTLAIKQKVIPAKKLFTTILYEGESCALAGVQPVTGTASALAPGDQGEATLQLARVFTEGEELKIGSSAATISGSSLGSTAKDESWSFL